jgi:hypothetical protein
MPSHPGDNARKSKEPNTGPRVTDVARVGYEAYGEWTEWKTHDGRDMPNWGGLSDRTRMAWVAAAGAITRKLLRPMPHTGGD